MQATPPKPVLESEEDIQNEIKGWVINKGLGETVLHRAARLGYTVCIIWAMIYLILFISKIFLKKAKIISSISKI